MRHVWEAIEAATELQFYATLAALAVAWIAIEQGYRATRGRRT